ncbi:MAG: tetratricopeptide repeat protein [Bacteroidota bacterium]
MGWKGIVFFLLSCLACRAQQGGALPDSVQRLMDTATGDSATVTRLNAIAFSLLKSKPEQGREVAAKAMELARSINFTRGYARALNVTGSSYWVVGEYESALDYYHLSAREAGAISDSVGISEAYHNMGEVYKKLGDYKKSIEFLTTSMEWDNARNLNRDIAMYNIGEAHFLLGNYSTAHTFYEQALSMAIKENDLRTLAYAYTGLGLIKYKHADFYQALAYFTRAEALWQEQGEIRSLIQAYQYFHDTFLELGQFKKAEEYINRAIQMAKEVKAPDLQISNLQRQAALYQRKGKYQLALEALTNHNKIKDSLYNEKRSEQIARLQTLFETEARDIENQQLKATQLLLDAQIRTQNLLLVTISGGLMATGLLAYVFFRQRKKILEVNGLLIDKTEEIRSQKEEIEKQSITLKNLNDQLQTLNRSLESKIEERTRQLTWQNKKLAAYAHANAHQLRAPIASILGLLSLIERLKLNPEDQILVTHLQKCGTELDRITREISRNLEEEEKTLQE